MSMIIVIVIIVIIISSTIIFVTGLKQKGGSFLLIKLKVEYCKAFDTDFFG